MDFGDILDEWERIRKEHRASSPPPAEKKPDTSAIDAWIGVHGTGDKDAEFEAVHGAAERGREARRLSELKIQAALDLHGMSVEEAEWAIADFVDSSSRRGLEKVLVIHGKGLHSAGAPVLKKVARRILEAQPLAGRFGEADKADGGTGALWVQIRRRSLR